MTKIEVEEYVKCLSKLKAGDIIHCHHIARTSQNPDTVARVIARGPLYDIKIAIVEPTYGLGLDYLYGSKEVGLVVIGIDEQGYKDSSMYFDRPENIQAVSFELLRLAPNRFNCIRFRTFDSTIKVMKIIKG